MSNCQSINPNEIRLDLKIIADLIKPNSKVLDIGCGNGQLLNFLKQNKNIDGRGLEISHTEVSKALIKGLSVIQGNAENDLVIYPDNSFDYAVLSQTIQATHNPPKILLEVLRIAKYGIVSLPNFAHFQNRFEIMFKGKMPVNKAIPFQWYETPNIHFCSIKDFEKLCFDLDIILEKKMFISSSNKILGFFSKEFFANCVARYGVFLISKNEYSKSEQEEFDFRKFMNLGYKTVLNNSFTKIKNNV